VYLSTTSREEIKREWQDLTASTVEVTVRVKWLDDICLPDPDGDDVVKAVFRRMEFEDSVAIDKQCTTILDEPDTMVVTDYDEARRMVVRRLLKSWTLDIPLECDEDGWLTDACFMRVVNLPAPLLTAMVVKYDKTNSITEEEDEKIDRQSVILFSKNSRGVSAACDAVSLFCNLSNFWEKFGLNYFDLSHIPFKTYLMLRIMIGKDSEAHAQMVRQVQSKNRAKPTMRGRNVGSPIVIQE